LRDTGCELADVKKKFVKEVQLTDKEIVIITIDGVAKVVLLAKIWVDTPFYVGELEAMVLKSLPRTSLQFFLYFSGTSGSLMPALLSVEN
jgi:hypothetical protein